VVSGKEVVKALSKIGYSLHHQTGSHMILRHREPPHRRITLPNHKEIANGTLRQVINDAGLTIDQFTDLL
jgi:predicted RNA binding protein YcfA (HicA-like mRNA interferase family)